MQLTPQEAPQRLARAEMVRVDKGWGHELWIVNEGYCGKLLHFRAGKKCSWHFHRVKDEVFFLHQGRLLVRFGFTDDLTQASSVVLESGMSFRVPVGLRHQMEAQEDSDLFEFSTHHDEADSFRLIKGD
jgi:mannose-6-phosphate isomerase-like protein (cupin superfamily)